MTPMTVVLCPSLGVAQDEAGWRELEAVLRAWGVAVIAPRRRDADAPPEADERLEVAGWVADQAVTITAAHVETPLILVTRGAANRALPALGFSQRAARHSVVGYILIDGPLPEPSRASADWPDAPVIYVQGPGSDPDIAQAARLRGWSVQERDPAEAVLDICRAWPDHQP